MKMRNGRGAPVALTWPDHVQVVEVGGEIEVDDDERATYEALGFVAVEDAPARRKRPAEESAE
jgi:hypothetical protein